MEKLESLVIDTDKFKIDVNGKSLIKEAIEIDVHITNDGYSIIIDGQTIEQENEKAAVQK